MPVWEIVERWLEARGRVAPMKARVPRLMGVAGNPGIV